MLLCNVFIYSFDAGGTVFLRQRSQRAGAALIQVSSSKIVGNNAGARKLTRALVAHGVGNVLGETRIARLDGYDLIIGDYFESRQSP
jgi:hypothetical protein